MQAYAYCGCYYTIPASLADCANEQLQPQAQVTGTVPPTSTPATAITTTSDMVAIAANTTENPTPPAAALSGVPSPLSTQSTVPISNPAFPNASTIRLASLNPTTPSHDPNTPWTPNAAPATSPEPLTIMLTYTTTLTAAGYTTTATLTSASISTLYTCPDDSDITFPAPAPTPSALTRPPPIGLAPVVSEPLTPLSATVLALSTGAGIGQGTTEYRPSRSPSISISSATAPFVAPSPLSSGVGISGTTAGRNASKVCAACGRRSKIF
ncbi:hypothetical protein IMSHALPRED_000946 [Imshaugia aleurites]|uniref:Uncharacterized protein n=1 Tax=Imshaugia aleurites TaxID=172621 RepID=A0A8H3EZS8_9LECA|nr:hypothetical protein IMSHALPRED_000946 [Imshaugia aleurites]